MKPIRPQLVYIGEQTIEKLSQFCRVEGHDQLLLVADQNTYAALGERAAAALEAQGFDLKVVCFSGPEVVADAHHILQVLITAGGEARTFVAVGSGTITDITRFTSHRTRQPFIAMPTAPSVDGFTSIGAPTIVAGVKTTLIAQPPIAVLADIKTLTAAPRTLVAAGFGDMMGKYTSVADWRLGHLLWDEPYDEAIAGRMLKTAQDCAAASRAIGQASQEGVRLLLASLLESGYGILDFGSSLPASGAEHHISHLLEMKLMREGRAPILHGAKVGAATVQVAALYDHLKALSPAQMADRLASATMPDRDRQVRQIEHAYGPLAGQIIAGRGPFLDMPAQTYDHLKEKIRRHWADIQAIAGDVPTAQTIREQLGHVNGPVDAEALGLSREEFTLALDYGHYLRERFTICKLNHFFPLRNSDYLS